MKSLKTVQTISKVLGILAKIGFVCTIIGAAGALVGGIVLAASPYISEDILKLIMSEITFENPTQLGISLIAFSVFLAGTAVAAGFTLRYFKNELKDDTPFTHRGAKELLKTGIINLAVPMGAFCICVAITACAGVGNLLSVQYDAGSGIAMILLSFVFSYGADLVKGKRTDTGKTSTNKDNGMNGSETAETVSTMTMTDIL